MLLARARRFVHLLYWLVRMVVWIAFGKGAPPIHGAVTTGDLARPLGRRTIEVACSCERVFWTRDGYRKTREGAYLVRSV